jgi:hypothetical protein
MLATNWEEEITASLPNQRFNVFRDIPKAFIRKLKGREKNKSLELKLYKDRIIIRDLK